MEVVKIQQTQMLCLGTLSAHTLQAVRGTKQNQSSNQNGNDQLFHFAAPPFPVPKRRIAVWRSMNQTKASMMRMA